MTRILYATGGPAREIALTEDGALIEYLREDASAASTEAIYLGIVRRVMPGMSAAFVDIGEEKMGFLPLNENSATFAGQPLRTGMRVAVQVRRAAQGTKGAFLTRDITLCGETVLLMPMNRHIGVSARVTDAEDIAALKTLGAEIAGERFGLVMRRAAAEADPQAVRGEADSLLAHWEAVAKALPTAHAPSMVDRPRTLLDALLEDELPRGIDALVTEDAALAESLAGRLPCRVEEAGVMERHGLIRQRNEALQRRVQLPGGGNLVIDPCEALTVIDVNTARHSGESLRRTVLETNLEAVREAARQMRLRNLGGIVLMDLIDMTEEDDRAAVLDALREALARDRVKTVVHGYTSLGLVEMTRKRVRRTLAQDWAEPCPRCGGSGIIPRQA